MEIIKFIGVWILYGLFILIGIFGILFLILAAFRSFKGISNERRNEILGLFLLLLSALIFLSLLTYDPLDFPELSKVHNLGGWAGAFVSHWLITYLGIASFVVPAILLLWSINRFRKLPYQRPFQITFILASLSILFIAFLATTNLEFPLEYSASGIVGQKLSLWVITYLGKLGFYILMVFLVLIIVTAGAEVSVIRIMRAPLKIPLVFKKLPEKKGPKAKISKRAVREKFIETARVEEKTAESVKRKPVVLKANYREAFLALLKSPEERRETVSKEELKKNAAILEEKFSNFDIEGKVTNFSPGPVITRYGFEPAPGIKLSRITSLSDDLALAMKANRIRIVAPIPGKSVVGIEIPNRRRYNVYIKEMLTEDKYLNSPSKLQIALGKDIAGNPDSADLSVMPHLLIAGTTGSGKSVCINSIITSILFRATEGEVRFIMIDPKRLELPVYNGIPHLLMPVITEAREALEVLKEVIEWMDKRYRKFAQVGVRDLEGYNERIEDKKPYIVVIIDELADLMIQAPSEIEEKLTRLAQMSRAVGIHLVLATQRPSVDVLTGLIKANFPARIAFQVASKTDSRTILDMNGAEKLLGKGDMLFLPPGRGEPVRLHGAYISTSEARQISNLLINRYLSNLLEERFGPPGNFVERLIERNLIDALAEEGAAKDVKLSAITEMLEENYSISTEEARDFLDGFNYYRQIEEETQPTGEKMEGKKEEEEGTVDELFKDAARLVVRHKLASVSLLQRRLKIGYARAGRIIDQLEAAGIVGPFEGSKARDVLVDEEELENILKTQ